MIETLQENQELLDSEIQDLWNLKWEIEISHIQEDLKEEKKENPYKETIENQKSPITHWNKENPKISITFDDWYWTENINHILETLEWSWIKATFFILWDCLRNTPDLRNRAVEQWHQICCHTFSHIYLSSEEYTDLWDKAKWIKAWPWKLNKTDLDKWTNNVKNLLWENYLNTIKSESWEWFPRKVKTDLLLKTEILMREEQIKKTLWEEYLQNFKTQYPFFRFPGWCWSTNSNNIKILKELWYLSIGWNEDFFRWTGKNRRHITKQEIKNMNINNWDIPLFHFKKNYKSGSSEREYIDAYIESMQNKNKTSHEISEIIK